jgi:hypothetical protein
MAMALVSRMIPTSMVARVRPAGSAEHVHANAQRCDAEMEIDRDSLLVGGDNRDWWCDKALHIRLD